MRKNAIMRKVPIPITLLWKNQFFIGPGKKWNITTTGISTFIKTDKALHARKGRPAFFGWPYGHDHFTSPPFGGTLLLLGVNNSEITTIKLVH